MSLSSVAEFMDLLHQRRQINDFIGHYCSVSTVLYWNNDDENKYRNSINKNLFLLFFHFWRATTRTSNNDREDLQFISQHNSQQRMYSGTVGYYCSAFIYCQSHDFPLQAINMFLCKYYRLKCSTWWTRRQWGWGSSMEGFIYFVANEEERDLSRRTFIWICTEWTCSCNHWSER